MFAKPNAARQDCFRCTVIMLCGTGLLALAFRNPASSTMAAARRFQEKLNLIAANARAHGRHAPVTLTALGVNSWFAGPGAGKLPAGVSHLLLSSQPGWVLGSAQVDFNRLRRAHAAGNPIAELLFNGTHQIFVRARVLNASAPAATLRLESFSLDGRQIPNALLDWAIVEFVQPRNPQISRQFQVKLPQGVRRVLVGSNRATLYY